jgi:hypothetical protein
VKHWAAIIAIVLLTSGCSVHSRQIAPNAGLIKQIGLPVYPNATAIRGQELANSSKLGAANQLQVMFTTHDDISRVQDFYAKRVPKDARKIVVPLGFTTTTAYQWYEKNVQKQVMFEKVKEMTIIELQAMTLNFPASSQSATPNAQPTR